jgi:UDP-2,3-diacylglucosamine pyrophosphatase LpxH
MGGERSALRNFQIFNRGQRLANFIRHLKGLRPGEKLGLVLNGDIIDSLAEDCVPGYVALDVDTAVLMINRICNDAAFAPVWTALNEFVHTAGRQLVLVIGNHDIELALGPVEDSIRRRLADGDPEANARIIFATHGGGFGCTVGAKRVFCTHGNEVDGWNNVDYSELGYLDNAMSAGRRIDPLRWVPNAGTRLVIDLMNKVKERHPFVDLLKPEGKSVLSVLLTLDPSLVKLIDLGDSFKIVRNLMSGNSEVKNLLSAGRSVEEISSDTLAAAALTHVLGQNLAQEVRGAQENASKSEDELLMVAERNVAAGMPAVTDDSSEVQTLGWTDVVSGWIGRVKPAEAVRRALQDWLGKDTTFDLEEPDPTFNQIRERVGPGVDYIITGHTHLARAIEYASGRHYYNCGTWIRLLRLTREVLSDAQLFEQRVYDVMSKRTMDALDDASIPGPNGTDIPLVLDRTDAVQISRNGSGVTSAILRVSDGKNGDDVAFKPETGGID